MTNITENSVWESGVFQLETNTPTLGGPAGFDAGAPVTGHANAQAQQLANRTSYLKNKVDVDIPNSTDVSKGAALVGFKQDGSGTIGRNVRSKLSEFVSVRDYGAVGDGVYDDTAAFQLALDMAAAGTGSLDIFVPPGSYRVRSLQFQSSKSLRIHGCGEVSEIRITGTDADAYSYTIGTTTVSANILFNVGGEAKPEVCDLAFAGDGATSVTYAVAFHKFFRGSKTNNLSFRRFEKPGAVPVTYHNCVSTEAAHLVANYCSRFIRIVGMADAVHFIQPTAYFFNKTYSQIFNEVGYLSPGDPNRYTVQTIFDGPYCYGSEVMDGTFIDLQNSSKVVIRDVWPEGVEYAVKLTDCDKFNISAALSSVSTSGFAKIQLNDSLNCTVDSEGAVELVGAGCIENTIFTKTNISGVTFSNSSFAHNLVIAKDATFFGRPLTIADTVTFNASGGSSTGSGTIESSALNTFKVGSFLPFITGGVTSPTITYTERTGRFQRVGSVVNFSIRIRVDTTSGGSGEIRIRQLPYTASHDISGSIGEVHTVTNTPNSWNILAGNDYITLKYSFNTNQVSDLNAQSTFRFTGFYFVA